MDPNNRDNADKTVFRQPVNRGDGTVVRPVPGGRLPAGAPPPMQSAPSAHRAPPQYKSAQPSHIPHVDLIAQGGLNPLVNAASTLLAVFYKTRDSMSHPNIASLRRQLENEITLFDTNAREAGIKPEVILSARYILCAILDEAVLNTPWGAESAWNQRTLLSHFHNETAGGEKFFMIVDKMRHSSAENIDFIELSYICISLGFEGKYRVISRGREALEQMRDDLFQIIRNHRGEYERTLSSNWQGLGVDGRSLSSHIPLWVTVSVVGALMAMSYTGARYWMHHTTQPVTQELVEISKTDVIKKTKLLKKTQ